MATSTAPTAWFARTNGSAGHYRPRQLWQVPVCLAGLVLLVGVCLMRPLWVARFSQETDRSLAEARRMLEQPDCQIERMQAYLQHPLSQANRAPLQAGAAHFLLGSAYLKHAEKAGADGDADNWRQARAQLEQAELLGVPEEDRLRLAYRIGKVLYHDGEDPQRVLDHLAPSVAEAADDPADGYAMLTQAYLRLPEPDLLPALEANRRLLDLPTLDENVLAPARLLRGEVLLRLQQPDEAREVLKFIKSPAAPAALVARARFLQAQTYQAEEQWARAAQLWKDALASGAASAQESGTIFYNLGLCYQHLGERQEAARIWEKAEAQGNDDAALAAAVGLAELLLTDAESPAALRAFGRVVHHVKTAADWHNALVDLERLRATFERGCLMYHVAGRYAAELQLTTLYEHVAAPGVAQAFAAQAAEAQARSLREEARQKKSAEDARFLEEEARTLFRQAGRQHEAALATAPTPAEQAERLWHSAVCFFEGQDFTTAVPALQRWIRGGQPADRLGEAWYRLAEAYRALHQEGEAVQAYSESVKRSGPFAYRARYELAAVEIARGEVDKAADDLELNRKLLRFEPDPEAEEKSLYELGGLLFKRNDFFMACYRLDEALHQYPNSPRALVGWFQLAECYRNLAAEEDAKLRAAERTSADAEEFVRSQYRSWLEKATGAYDSLVKTLSDQLAAGRLSGEEEAVYRLAAFAAAECRSNLGDNRGAIAMYEQLAVRYHHQVEGLHALAGVATCCWRDHQEDQAQQTVAKIRQMLTEMDDATFAHSAAGSTRKQWQDWLEQVSRRSEPSPGSAKSAGS
jgi:tetratricopeptide (TPR) repeat protein